MCFNQIDVLTAVLLILFYFAALTIYIITYLLIYGDKLNTINETFTEEEFNELKRIKVKTGRNWHDFIMFAAHSMNAGGE